jgi:type IV pilus assembly protein PilA
MSARLRSSTADSAGFTLIEVLVAIIVIGVLAALAIPVFLHQRSKGWDAQAKSDLRNIAALQEANLTLDDIYVVAADKSAAMAALASYEPSPQVTAVLIKNYTTVAATTLGTTPTKFGFCAEATSESGRTFVYDSVKGGLLGQKPASGAPNCS